MKPVLAGIAGAVLVAGLAVAAGCASLATPQAPSTSSPSASSSGGTVQVSQQVKDGAQLYVDLACIRCHAPDGVGGIPNRLNAGGDSTIPPLNNTYRDPSEQFKNPLQITQVLSGGSIVSKKPGVINMPSWNGVINDAQASAIAAYIMAGFPHTGVAYDPDPAKARTSTRPSPASTVTARWAGRARRIPRPPTRKCRSAQSGRQRAAE